MAGVFYDSDACVTARKNAQRIFAHAPRMRTSRRMNAMRSNLFSVQNAAKGIPNNTTHNTLILNIKRFDTHSIFGAYVRRRHRVRHARTHALEFACD